MKASCVVLKTMVYYKKRNIPRLWEKNLRNGYRQNISRIFVQGVTLFKVITAFAF